MKKRPGKENALIFGVGMGGFESILNGATVYITNIIAALLINSIGSTEYFKKLALKERNWLRPRSYLPNRQQRLLLPFLWMLPT